MKNTNVRMLVEAGVMIALAQVLSYVVIYQMPQGGSVTAGSMVPILLFAVRWGTAQGLLAGAVYGILQFILGPKWSFTLFLFYLITLLHLPVLVWQAHSGTEESQGSCPAHL